MKLGEIQKCYDALRQVISPINKSTGLDWQIGGGAQVSIWTDFPQYLQGDKEQKYVADGLRALVKKYLPNDVSVNTLDIGSDSRQAWVTFLNTTVMRMSVEDFLKLGKAIVKEGSDVIMDAFGGVEAPTESCKRVCSMQKKKESLSKVAESIDGAVFTLKSCKVGVYDVDDENDEDVFVNAWDLKEYDGMRFNSLQEVINLIANRGIHKETYTKPENWMAFGYSDKDGTLRLDTEVLVGMDDHPADDSTIERWKKGEVHLYTARYHVFVRCEYTAVVPKDAIKRETAYLGFDTTYFE